jgi:hypothetical protein
MCLDATERCTQLQEGVLDACLQSKSARCGHHAVALPLEKREAQFIFQLSYALANGAVRHVQFARRLGIAAMAASHLEHPQSFQRR